MNDVIEKLYNLLERLDRINPNNDWDLQTLIESKGILSLYINRFFKEKSDYIQQLEKIDPSPRNDSEHYEIVTRLKALILTLIEDIRISDNNIQITTEEEKNRILNQAREEAASQRKQLEIEAEEIRKIREEVIYERERLIAEESKFNEFKTKLEFADKELDFQSQARTNKNTAYFWAIIGGLLIITLIILLCANIDINNTFIDIAKGVRDSLKVNNVELDSTISTTIYFSFFKYIFTKIFLYSMLVYFIVFCFKNYNAQMHNHIINTHKSNAFKSTLSLLNTARSEDGNDKLLIQATQAIFSHQQTGYSTKESEQTSPNLITNVIDSVSKKI